jgi:hypothetical protein
MLGVSSVGAPLAARMEAQKAAARIASVTLPGLSGNNGGGIPATDKPGGYISPENKKLALTFPTVKKELESILYQAHSQIYRIDHDLAIKKSFSLSAKITFQRQRNVEASMEEHFVGPSWARLDNFWAQIAKRFFLGGKTTL